MIDVGGGGDGGGVGVGVWELGSYPPLLYLRINQAFTIVILL